MAGNRPDLSDWDSPDKPDEACGMVCVNMGQDHQLDPAYPVLPHLLHETNLIGTAIDQRQSPVATGHQNRVTLTDIEHDDPCLGQLRWGANEADHENQGCRY